MEASEARVPVDAGLGAAAVGDRRFQGHVDVVWQQSLTERAIAGVLSLAVAGGALLQEHMPSDGRSISERLASTDPGDELVELLASLDAEGSSTDAELDPDLLIEGIAAWERVIAWASARQAGLVSALAAADDSSRYLRYVCDEIASQLRVTRRAGEMKVALAAALDDLPAVAAMLSAGVIDVSKARIISDESMAVPREERDAVIGAVLSDAPRLTGPQLRAEMRKAAASVDPSAAERRAAREKDERCVTLTPATDVGMAYLTAYLPADAAMTCFTAIDALAGAGDPADGRGIDARRADALADVLRGVLDSGVGPYGRVPTRQRRRPHIQVTVAAGTLLGLDDAPAELAGYGPVPASMARAIAQDGTWRRVVLDGHGAVCCRGDATYRPGADLTGTVVARDATCTFPGCRVPAWRCDLDHVDPFDPARAASGQTHPSNLQALCRHHHGLKTHTSWAVSRDPASGVTTWISPLGRTYRREPYHPPGPPRDQDVGKAATRYSRDPDEEDTSDGWDEPPF